MSQASLRDAPVVGRERESSLVAAWSTTVADGARALLLRGDPGIGKTTLWRQALSAWRSAGGTVLVTRPVAEELAHAYSGLVDLLEHHIPDPVALTGAADPIARGRTVLGVLRDVAAERPALIAIDDLQWLDAASARALRYALRRLDSERVGILATMRTGSPAPDLLDLRNLLPPGRLDTVDIGPLDPPAVRRLVGGVLSTVSPRTLRRLYEVSGGNPMFALELARGLAAGGGTQRGLTDGRDAPPNLRMPESLQTAIGLRLDGLPADLLALLETVSALARGSVAQVRRALPEQDVDRLLDVAARSGLLTVDADLTVRFSHPMIGSVLYDRVGPLTRRRLHARLADLTDDADLRARHLARCTEEPDPAVATALEEAAGRASARGALGTAAEFAEQSLRLTPPSDTDAERRRTLELIRHLAAAGDMGQALDIADRAIARLPSGPARAEALVARAQLEDDDIDTGEALLERALDEAGDDEALRGRLLDQLGWLRGVFRGDLPGGIRYAREALRYAERSGDREFQMSAAAGLSNMETLAGTPRPDLMDRAVALEDEIGRPPLWAGPRVLRAEQLMWAGDLARARDLLEAAVAHAERQNHERWKPYSLYDLAAVEGAAGNLARADRLLGQAVESARDCEDAHVESWIFYRLALVAAWLGRADEARVVAGRRIAQATRRGERPGIARARSVLGLLALSEGDPRAAAAELLDAVHLLDEMGLRHPGAVPALPDAIEATVLAGQYDTAEALLERLTGQVPGCGAWADAALDRASGTVALARDAGQAAVALCRSAATFSALGYRPDAARAVLLAARAHQRAGQRTLAADAYAEARGEFAAMGARLWAQRAAEGLERVAPGRASGELTAAETRVAALVAEGRTNREIARELFMSVATVEAHLTRTYRKLRIRSRSDLTRLVMDGSLTVRRAAAATRRGGAAAVPADRHRKV
ncbi:AAA family ATPase [Micromonospora sp. WMMC415]|uniref:ATP-binding protein n=1 Tax=Micromonospora sp. WMMC415 TaxID=2675222 RepID=UPI0018AF59F8|nr:LuxR family transcriptional regulator [Micromonospora sp. WMMC415]